MKNTRPMGFIKAKIAYVSLGKKKGTSALTHRSMADDLAPRLPAAWDKQSRRRSSKSSFKCDLASWLLNNSHEFLPVRKQCATPYKRPVRSTVLVVEGAVLSHCSSKRGPLIEALAGSCSCLNSFVVSCEEVPSKPGLLRLAGPGRECYWASATLKEEMLTG